MKWHPLRYLFPNPSTYSFFLAPVPRTFNAKPAPPRIPSSQELLCAEAEAADCTQPQINFPRRQIRRRTSTLKTSNTLMLSLNNFFVPLFLASLEVLLDALARNPNLNLDAVGNITAKPSLILATESRMTSAGSVTMPTLLSGGNRTKRASDIAATASARRVSIRCQLARGKWIRAMGPRYLPMHLYHMVWSKTFSRTKKLVFFTTPHPALGYSCNATRTIWYIKVVHG